MFNTLPGFREFYPEDCAVRNHFFRVWRQAARAFGFLEYDAPVLEPTELYIEKSGAEIVGQLFNFTDKGGREVSLRPEMTPSLARLVGARANGLKRPVKWFSIGENYRYERQQKGRLRAFYQFNADILGEEGVGADAECIGLAVHTLRAFGLNPEDVRVRLSDRTLWLLFLESLGVSPAAAPAVLTVVDKAERMPVDKLLALLKTELEKNNSALDAVSLLESMEKFRALQSLDAIEATLAGSAQTALQERLQAWRSLLGKLQAMGLGDYVQVDMGIVRGLAYYTGFVFEVFQADGEGRALAGGGRYDHLVQKLGGPDMPAVGFAMGDVTLRNLLEEKNRLPQYVQAVDVFMVVTDELSLECAVEDAARLRAQNIAVEYPLKSAGNFAKQIKAAGNSGARLAVIYGDDLESRGEVRVRDLRSREESAVNRTELMRRLSEALF